MSSLSSIIFTVMCIGYALGSCPAGWTQFSSSCYKWQQDLENWVEARKFCQWHNSDLMAIETQAEQTWFRTEARKYNLTGDDEGFWLGATDWTVEGKWVWESSNNALLTTYSAWGQSQPNNRLDREHCLAAVHYFDFLWSDEYCDGLKIQYVCERKATSGAPIG